MEIPSATKGVASKSFVYFSIFEDGDYADVGGGSSTGTVEVMDVSDSAITVHVSYRDTIQDAELVLEGDYGVNRCPP